jgi:hypothetical protein
MQQRERERERERTCDVRDKVSFKVVWLSNDEFHMFDKSTNEFQKMLTLGFNDDRGCVVGATIFFILFFVKELQ